MERPPRYCHGRGLSIRDEDFLAWLWVDMRWSGRYRRAFAAFADRAVPVAGCLLFCQIIGKSAPVADRASEVWPAHRGLATQRCDPAAGEMDGDSVDHRQLRHPGADGGQAADPGYSGCRVDLCVGVYLDPTRGLKPMMLKVFFDLPIGVEVARQAAQNRASRFASP